MQVKKQQLELDMEQHWFQIGKGVCQGYILSPCLFNLNADYIMRNAGLDEVGIEITGEISIISDMQMTGTLMEESEEELKSLLVKESESKESEKVGLKLKFQKTKIMASGPITLW